MEVKEQGKQTTNKSLSARELAKALKESNKQFIDDILKTLDKGVNVTKEKRIVAWEIFRENFNTTGKLYGPGFTHLAQGSLSKILFGNTQYDALVDEVEKLERRGTENMKKKEARHLVNKTEKYSSFPVDGLQEYLESIDVGIIDTLYDYFNTLKIKNTQTDTESY